MDFGTDAWWPLADFATSRGRGAGAPAFPEAAVVDGASMISSAPRFSVHDHITFIAIPLERRSWCASLCEKVFRH